MLLTNMSKIDRGLRFILGVGLLGLYGALESPWKYVTLLGLVLIGTAISGFCPAYRLMGISSCRRPAER